jgi:hypothetical protein
MPQGAAMDSGRQLVQLLVQAAVAQVQGAPICVCKHSARDFDAFVS